MLMTDLAITMSPLLWVGLFGWALNLSTGQTVLAQAVFTVIALLGLAAYEFLARRNEEEA
jgi:hypothetical protein